MATFFVMIEWFGRKWILSILKLEYKHSKLNSLFEFHFISYVMEILVVVFSKRVIKKKIPFDKFLPLIQISHFII